MIADLAGLDVRGGAGAGAERAPHVPVVVTANAGVGKLADPKQL